ncbi:toprim domain-containing protein [Nocardia abscessus]|uniref:Toprim domain-containing protein n=1 Tax=Nocardia abscessus TaxID=120957 RepID=A0ABS0C6N5_9NOCA|nr:toprim domain-containing protein [Nocardia abscessus]MBF6226030.1 toprim domain-containing protein [Nocardia abscessus]
MPEPTPQRGRSYEVVTAALIRRVGPARWPREPQQWTNYLCPVHEGDGHHHNPSLGVRYDPRQGKTMVRCWARCDDQDVLDRIGLRVRDLWDRLPERDPNRRATTGAHGQRYGVTERRPLTPVERAIAAARFPILAKRDLGAQIGRPVNVDTYVYKWPDGRVEGAVTRVHTPHEHGHAKSFWQAHWTGTEWVKEGFAPIPWKLADIREALDTGREIFVCEGEKDVQRANRAGLIATCNAMGAGSWTPEHARWLAGAGRVIVVADRDRPGYQHAAKVADSLTGRVGEVRVLQARSGKDLSDHFDAGYDLTDLAPVPHLDRPHQQQERFRTPAMSQGRTRSR